MDAIFVTLPTFSGKTTQFVSGCYRHTPLVARPAAGPVHRCTGCPRRQPSGHSPDRPDVVAISRPGPSAPSSAGVPLDSQAAPPFHELKTVGGGQAHMADRRDVDKIIQYRQERRSDRYYRRGPSQPARNRRMSAGQKDQGPASAAPPVFVVVVGDRGTEWRSRRGLEWYTLVFWISQRHDVWVV